MISEQVGKKLREHRKKAGLSLESLALSAEITPNFLGDVERGVKKPSVDTLESILAVLGLTFSEFFNFEAGIKSDGERLELKKIISGLRRLSDEELKIIDNIIRQVKNYGNLCKKPSISWLIDTTKIYQRGFYSDTRRVRSEKRLRINSLYAGYRFDA